MLSGIVKPMINFLILDADGVLINGEKFAEVLSRDFPIDKAKEKEFFTTTFQDCLVGKADLMESIAPYLPSFGWKGTADEFLDYWFKTEHSVNEELLLYAQRLRRSGVTVVLATNQEKYRTQYMLEHMGFDGMFDKIYSSAHLGLKKPAIEFFAHITEDMRANKTEVLFWDDDQRNIDGAREYGINAEFYTDYDSFIRDMTHTYGLAA
jgi:HAD superfamily hydrolase (TIGR01509 family)